MTFTIRLKFFVVPFSLRSGASNPVACPHRSSVSSKRALRAPTAFLALPRDSFAPPADAPPSPALRERERLASAVEGAHNCVREGAHNVTPLSPALRPASRRAGLPPTHDGAHARPPTHDGAHARPSTHDGPPAVGALDPARVSPSRQPHTKVLRVEGAQNVRVEVAHNVARDEWGRADHARDEFDIPAGSGGSGGGGTPVAGLGHRQDPGEGGGTPKARGRGVGGAGGGGTRAGLLQGGPLALQSPIGGSRVEQFHAAKEGRLSGILGGREDHSPLHLEDSPGFDEGAAWGVDAPRRATSTAAGTLNPQP